MTVDISIEESLQIATILERENAKLRLSLAAYKANMTRIKRWRSEAVETIAAFKKQQDETALQMRSLKRSLAAFKANSTRRKTRVQVSG